VLVLHIGTHKTGTSALQAFFAAHTDELDRHAIHYLRSGRGAGKAHHELSWAIRGRHGADLSVWDTVRAELGANVAGTQVISSEAFWFTEPVAVREQLRDIKDLRVVMYLRRQDKYLQSLYKQTVAGGRRISFAEWREKYRFRGDYFAVVQQWAEAFGKDNLVIRPYERGGKTVDIVIDFLGYLGIDAAEEFEGRKRGRNNPSPRRELMELLRAFNQLDIDINRDKFFHEVIGRNKEYVRSVDLLTHEQCAALMEDFAEGNHALIGEFYRDSGPLFPELIPGDRPQIWDADSPEYFAMLVDLLDAVWMFARDPALGAPDPSKMKKNRRRGPKEIGP